MIIKEGDIYKNISRAGFVPPYSLWRVTFVSPEEPTCYTIVTVDKHKGMHATFVENGAATMEQATKMLGKHFNFVSDAGKGQSKLASLLEAKLNTAVGFVISVLLWQHVVPLIWPDMAPFTGVQTAIGITLLFTFTSVIRNYVLRRFINWWTHRRNK